MTEEGKVQGGSISGGEKSTAARLTEEGEGTGRDYKWRGNVYSS